MEKLNLTQEWDKVFPKSDKVDYKKVTTRKYCQDKQTVENNKL